ncbi:hypothetical protein H5P36_24505 [Bacillus sp. APMAM]|nr:hypothetical protein [Bacillus sp. APMAM]RTZ53273.1 hypothetical protein EKO25_24245 [Bacillus sp. SAJ1]
MSLNSDYNGKTNPDSIFWRELGVSIDSIMELDSVVITSILKNNLSKQKKDVLIDLCTLYGLELSDEKEKNVTSLLSMDTEKMREILILQDFQNRRKSTIDKFYKFKFAEEETQYNSSTLVRLKHLFESSLTTMIDIYTLYSWDIKSSGDKYTYAKGLKLKEALKIPTEYKATLINCLFKGSGSNKKYKVFSYTQFGSKVIVILYKQINDTLVQILIKLLGIKK